MNIQIPKISTVALILLGALAMLGATGAISPASAASILVNNNAKVTNYAQVTLNITPPPGTIEMRFQNELNLLTAWEPAAATKQWTLSTGTGVKTVSAQFRDALTKISAGAVSDTIIFDSIIDTSFNAASASYPGTANFANSAALATTATTANAVAVYPATAGLNAGKTVTVGTFDNGNGNTDIKVIRYNTNGTIDGQFAFDHAGFADSGNAVAIQSDGKIVVAGTCSRAVGVTDVCAVRLKDNLVTPSILEFDTAFGVNGVIDNIATGRDSAKGVAIQADGKIVVVGVTNLGGANSAWVLRFAADGKSIDINKALTDIVLADGFANAVAIQGDQKIVVVGTHNNALNDSSVWVMRLGTTGAEDLTFNPTGASPGHIFFGSTGPHTGNAVAVDPVSNKIVVVGTYNAAQAWVLQLNSNGSLDSTFNFVGSLALDGPVATRGNAVAIQADHKIVVVGSNDLGAGNTSALVARINNSGTLDTTLLDSTFNDGSYDYTFGTNAKFAGKAVALQPDGKIVVAGTGNASQYFTGSTSMLTLRLHDKTYPLTVTTVGSGTVAVFPGTLTNGTGNFVPESIIQLTATPMIGGATFVGWSGDCTGTGVCTVTMNAAKNVTATFSLPLTLSLHVTGTGTITASSTQGVLACTSNCSTDLPLNTVVSLSATPAWYTHFAGWSGGGCTGIGACSVTMSQSQNVTASFDPSMYVRLNGAVPYSTLFEAYIAGNNAGPTAIVDAQAFTFLENLLFNKLVTVNLNGGKDAVYSPAAIGYTTVSGSLKISSGRLNASNVKVKP